MLTLAIFLPLVGLAVVAVTPSHRRAVIRAVALAATVASLSALLSVWARFEGQGGFELVERAVWIPSLGVGYAVGVDGLSLPLLLMTAVLFLASLTFSWPEDHRVKEYFGWFLLLETACLGVFAALDLFLFYVFWDLTLVAMYFIIAVWGHGGARAAALKFFVYTFVGSIALLLGIIALFLAMQPRTTDMAAIIAARPLDGAGAWAVLAFAALFVGFAVKTPTVPFHTWLPPAHGEAPAPGSAILAGVLLKMGTYGLLRILMQMMPATFRDLGMIVLVVGVVSALYGALAALAQTDLKRLIAYTSVNHMGYVVMAVAASALAGGVGEPAELAVDGAVLQMVSHALLTGGLFLIAGVVWRRTGTFEIGRFGGLSQVVPVLSAVTAVAAFGSLGLPGLSGFVAEFQIFVGAFGVVPWSAVALLGIVVTAALFLRMLQNVFLGPLDAKWRGLTDMALHERLAIMPLLGLSLAIGLLPFWILDVVVGYARALGPPAAGGS